MAAGAGAAALGAATAAANLLALPRLSYRGPVAGRVAVLVPARDEAARLPALLADLAAQRGVPGLRVWVLDDDSGDGTYQAALAAVGGDPRFHLARSTAPPPPGWLGKQAACAALAARAAADDPEVLVFLDADVRLAPHAVAAAVAALRGHDLDLLSPWPTQLAGGVAERLVQPLLAWSWLSTVPLPLAHRLQLPSMAVACGQFLVFDAAAYRRHGGHAAVAGSTTEDLDIARHLRRRGGRTAVAGAAGLASCRMYEDGAALRAGYGRWLGRALGPPPAAAAVGAVLALAYLAPPAALLLGRGRARRWGAAGWAAAGLSRWLAARAEGARPRAADIAAHPASVVAAAALHAHSRRVLCSGGAAWKGRPVR